jgi:dephospho-CoA kinase
MIVVGLTGGIGSGKSTIAGFFKKLGVPVYIADEEARKLMHTPALIAQVTALFGHKAYTNGILNRSYIASLVFNDGKLLQQLNAIVHPTVSTHFKQWSQDQQAPYVIKEAAILFENQGYKECYFTILVTAPLATRIKRVIKRDHTNEEKVLARIEQQWEDEKKIPMADFVIDNINLKRSEKETRKIHVKILRTLVNS